MTSIWMTRCWRCQCLYPSSRDHTCASVPPAPADDVDLAPPTPLRRELDEIADDFASKPFRTGRER